MPSKLPIGIPAHLKRAARESLLRQNQTETEEQYPKLDLATILHGIRSGDLDEGMERLSGEITFRKDYLNRLKFKAFNIGDRVRFVETSRPRYLAYQQGTVREIRRSRVVVDLDFRVGRFQRGIRCPVALLEKV